MMANLPVLLVATIGFASPADTTLVQPVDTTLAVERGDRIILENVSGEITIEAWDRDVLEVRSDDEESGLVARRSGRVIRIELDDRKGRRRSVEASIRLPGWVELQVSGRVLDLWVDGVDESVDVSTVSGDVWVRNAGGPVDVRTIEGEVDISAVRSGVRASSQSDDVRLRDVSGPVEVHSGSGDLALIDIRSTSVRAETQDGDIEFSGTISSDGEYGFFVHDGDAMVAIPEDASARVSVSTFDGEFESEFPVVLQRFTGGREFDFTVGEGRARIEIQVFDGEIRLLRRRD